MAREDKPAPATIPSLRPAARPAANIEKAASSPAVIAHMALVTASECAQKAAANSASPAGRRLDQIGLIRGSVKKNVVAIHRYTA
jgi:hypothetical protein